MCFTLDNIAEIGIDLDFFFLIVTGIKLLFPSSSILESI